MLIYLIRVEANRGKVWNLLILVSFFTWIYWNLTIIIIFSAILSCLKAKRTWFCVCFVQHAYVLNIFECYILIFKFKWNFRLRLSSSFDRFSTSEFFVLINFVSLFEIRLFFVSRVCFGLRVGLRKLPWNRFHFGFFSACASQTLKIVSRRVFPVFSSDLPVIIVFFFFVKYWNRFRFFFRLYFVINANIEWIFVAILKAIKL